MLFIQKVMGCETRLPFATHIQEGAAIFSLNIFRW
jgi:hypothetical protein